MCPKISLDKPQSQTFMKIFQSCSNNLTKLIITGSKLLMMNFNEIGTI